MLVEVVVVVDDAGYRLMDEWKIINEKKTSKTCESVCCKSRLTVRTSRIKPVNRGDGGFVILRKIFPSFFINKYIYTCVKN